jgi:hypothetical protein
MAGPLFPLGVVVATPATIELLEKQGMDPEQLLTRHVSDDWEELGTEDQALNDQAVREDLRIFSAYDLARERLWIITEADRSATTILLPSEY